MDHQKQTYDISLKDLFREQAPSMLGYLLEGAQFLGELNTEVLKPLPPLRADRVYKILYRRTDHILHLEFQVRGNKNIPLRMVSYNVLLHEEHHLPVISLILYPFRTALPESPYRVMSGDQELLKLAFIPMPLWKLKAAHFLDEHALDMYPLLPTMEGVDASMIIQAIRELAMQYNGDGLSRRLVCLRTLLNRVETLPSTDKRAVEEHLAMFDEFLEEDPFIRKIRLRAEAEGKAKGEAEGKAKGEAEGKAKGAAEGKAEAMQEAVIDVVETRFPALLDLAQERVKRIYAPEVLKALIKRLVVITDEDAARSLLNNPAA